MRKRGETKSTLRIMRWPARSTLKYYEIPYISCQVPSLPSIPIPNIKAQFQKQTPIPLVGERKREGEESRRRVATFHN